MAEIKVSPDVLRMNAGKLREIEASLNETMNSLKLLHEQMTYAWDGVETEMWRQKFNNCEELPMRELKILCSEYAAYIMSYAEMMENAEMELFSSLMSYMGEK